MRASCLLGLLLASTSITAAPRPDPLPLVVITRDDTLITQSPPFDVRGPNDPLVLLQLRDLPSGHHLQNNAWFSNQTRILMSNAVELALPPGTVLLDAAPLPPSDLWRLDRTATRRDRSTIYSLRGTHRTRLEIPGSSNPLGARTHLRGRRQILLDEWGPWDHESPFLLARPSHAGGPAWDVLGVTHLDVRVLRSDATVIRTAIADGTGQRVALRTPPGVTDYELEITGQGFKRVLRGNTLRAEWDAAFFSWRNGPDPRANLLGWRALASGSGATHAKLDALRLPYGGRGPRDLQLSRGSRPPDRSRALRDRRACRTGCPTRGPTAAGIGVSPLFKRVDHHFHIGREQ